MVSQKQILLFLNLLIATNAFAMNNQPSFDCKKANTTVEKKICSNDQLAQLDNELSKVFFSLKNHPQGRLKMSVDALMANQKAWLKERNQENCDDQCLIKIYQDRIALLSFPGMPKPLTENSTKQLAKFFEDKDCEYLSEVASGEMFVTDALQDFACKVYEVNPTVGSQLFGACYGSNRDNFMPWCDFKVYAKRVTGLGPYTEFLETLYGPDANSCGSLRYGQYRSQNSAIGEALYNTNLSTLKTDQDPLKIYSLKSLWNKQQYQHYLQLKQQAEIGLENYYIEKLKLSENKAQQLAANHVQNLAIEYTGHSSSRDSWGVSELNVFLKEGKLPSNNDFQYETILHLDFPDRKKSELKYVKPEILAYFLTLAIVNDYPINDIKKIIDAGANLKNPKLSDTALMNAVNQPEVVKLLIDRGANVNAQNPFGKTALMYALQHGNFASVKLLVENKADVNLSTFKPIDNCKYEITTGNRTPLMYAAWYANASIVDYLMAKGAKTDAKDTDGHDYRYYFNKIAPKNKT